MNPFTRMQAVVDKGNLAGVFWASVFAIYLTLGLFSGARWLQVKWGRWGGGVVPLSRRSRVLAILSWSLIAATCFAHAFHYHQSKLDWILLPALLFDFILLFFSAVGDQRSFKKRHDHAA